MTDDSGSITLRNFLVGVCMGTADAVPGVSGGTIALLAGIYDRLIDAFAAIGLESAWRALHALGARDAAGLRGVVEDVDGLFLGTIGVGLASALVVVSRVVHVLEATNPVALFGFFFGLIVASAVLLASQVPVETPRQMVAAVAGFLVAFVFSGNIELLAGHNLALTFVAGTVTITAMILPGISGALILVILGQYTYLTTTLSTFTDALAALVTGGALDRVLETGTVVVVFLAGGAVGLLTVARVVDRALAADRETTLAFLVALVVGALRAPINEITTRDAVAWTTGTILEFAVVAAVGAVVLLAIDHYAVEIDIDASDDGSDASDDAPGA